MAALSMARASTGLFCAIRSSPAFNRCDEGAVVESGGEIGGVGAVVVLAGGAVGFEEISGAGLDDSGFVISVFAISVLVPGDGMPGLVPPMLILLAGAGGFAGGVDGGGASVTRGASLVGFAAGGLAFGLVVAFRDAFCGGDRSTTAGLAAGSLPRVVLGSPLPRHHLKATKPQMMSVSVTMTVGTLRDRCRRYIWLRELLGRAVWLGSMMISGEDV